MKHNYLKFNSVVCLITFLIISILTGCSKSGSNPTPKSSTLTTTITSLSVNTGAYNTSVIITGTGFSSTIANDSVSFNGKAAIITAATLTQLTTTVPLGAGSGNVSVTVNNQTVKGPVFTYQLSNVISTFAGGNPAGENIDGMGTAASFDEPNGLAIDATGNLYVADQGSSIIRKITPAGLVSTLAGNSGNRGSANGQGSLATFNQPKGIRVDALGNIYELDGAGFYLIRKITSSGLVSTLAGGGDGAMLDGTGNKAAFQYLSGIAIDGSNNIWVTDYGFIRKVTPTGVVTTVFNFNSAGPEGIVLDKNGNIFVTGYTNSILKITPDGSNTIFAQGFNYPTNLTSDVNGNIFVTDSFNALIKEVSPTGVVTTLANGTRMLAYDVAVDTHGNIFATVGNKILKIGLQ